MAATAFTAQGSKLFVNNTQIRGITEYTLPSGERAEIDVTDLDSTAREFKLGLRDNGEFEFSGQYLPDDPGQQALDGAQNTEASQTFRLELPINPSTGAVRQTLEFQGLVRTYGGSGSVDEVVSMECTVRVTGDVVKTT